MSTVTMKRLGHDRRAVKSWQAAPEEMSLEETTEDGQLRCWRDVLWKTVPHTRGGDRKSSVTDGWQPRTVELFCRSYCIVRLCYPCCE